MLRISTSITSTLPVSLRYDAAGEFLSGQFPGSLPIRMRAVSGGGRGSISSDVAENTLRSRQATTPMIKNGADQRTQRGGTLPPGLYRCVYVATHPRFGECIRLLRDAAHLHVIHSPFASAPIPHGRGNDFFIHGRGHLGSDGCIVPLIPNERQRLNEAVRAHAGPVTLEVVGVNYMLPAEHFNGTRA